MHNTVLGVSLGITVEMVGLSLMSVLPGFDDNKVLLYIGLSLASVVLGVLIKRAGLLLDKLIDSPSREEWKDLGQKVAVLTSLLDRRIAGDDPWKRDIERRISSIEDAA